MILCLYREISLVVVTAALKLEPDTTFLVNANVPKNVTSADLSSKNKDFLLITLGFLTLFSFSPWSESQTSEVKERQDSVVSPATGVGSTAHQGAQHTLSAFLYCDRGV